MEHTHRAQSHLVRCQETHTRNSKEAFSGVSQGDLRRARDGSKREEGRCGFSQIPWKRSHWDFLCSCRSNPRNLFPKEGGIKSRCVIFADGRSQFAACVGGGLGRGMTIGFREQAMGTDGPWLPPKIPLRKMAGLTYFWTHHAVQMDCRERERGRGSAFISYNPQCFGSTLWD